MTDCFFTASPVFRTAALLVALASAETVPAEEIRLPVTRDTWLSDVGAEADGSNGGSPRLKLKSYQEMTLLDIDPAPLRGRVVLKATLHLKSTGEPILHRVTVGSVGSSWVEGSGTGYAHEPGASTFRHREYPAVPWTLDGGDFCRVILGQGGGTVWRSSEATPPDAQGWQTVNVAPEVMAARVAGISGGFLAFDDTGSEWTRQGQAFEFRHMPNRFVFGKDSNRASAPYFHVELGPEDHLPPGSPTALASEDPGQLPAGEAVASWDTPPDSGPAGTAGFLVAVDGREVPRDQIPRAGGRVKLRLRDLGLRPGSEVTLAVRAVNGAGNLGPEAKGRVRVSGRVAKPLPAEVPVAAATPEAPKARGGFEVAVIDELDKWDPNRRAVVPEAGPGYLASNHLWDAGRLRIRLQAARNEVVGFQVVVTGESALGRLDRLRPVVDFNLPKPDPTRFESRVGRLALVGSKLGPMPDPVTDLDAPATPHAGGTSFHVEVYVPKDAKAGEHVGSLTLSDGRQTLGIAVELEVWGFTLPDALSFLPELNCYGLPDDELAYYRLAHRHRTAVNRVPYSQRGEMAPGMAPKITREGFDWSGYDRRFGPLLDGSAFVDSPRAGVPLDVFYLPLHENWPTPIEGSYNGEYWADRAFSAEYRRAFVEASRRFAEHLDARGWHSTVFQGFLNNKVDFKKGPRGWLGGSSPWLLDEPANFQDFAALRYFGSAFKEGLAQARSGKGAAPRAKLAFRADVSRPQWQRDSLDGILDYNVAGGEVRNRLRMVLDRKADQGQMVVEYGTTNRVEESNVMPAAWCLDVWSLGLDGVIPWDSIGRAESWKTGDELALLYPPLEGKGGGPTPSVRLKAYRRGQQDVEYLTMLALATGEPRWAVGERVRETLKLSGRRESKGGTTPARSATTGFSPETSGRSGSGSAASCPGSRPPRVRALVDWQPRGG